MWLRADGFYADGTLFHGPSLQLLKTFGQHSDAWHFSARAVNAPEIATGRRYCPLVADALLQAALVVTRMESGAASLPVMIEEMACDWRGGAEMAIRAHRTASSASSETHALSAETAGQQPEPARASGQAHNRQSGLGRKFTMERIAIISAACLFPDAADLDTYWNNLISGRDCRSPGSDQDFGIEMERFRSSRPEANKIYCTTGGFVRDFRFDAEGFQLPADQLAELDEVFQWPLHTAREALIGARSDQAINLARTGLILGNYTFPTRLSNCLAVPLWHQEISAGVASALTGAASVSPQPVEDEAGAANLKVGGLPPWLVARALGLGGPQFAIDAACSSAIYAIDLACAYLRTGRADAMLAGSVCAPDPWLIHLSFSGLKAYPVNGRSAPFDRDSMGIHTGQGAGMVVLKRLSDAQAAGDEILAIIEGIGLSNDGAGKHMLSPNPLGQQLAYERAYTEAGLPRERVDYVECHATGTPLGDRTELESLSSFFDSCGHRPLIGSVKANLGHLLTVAGLSSLIKVMRSMHEGVIPPTIGVDALRDSESGRFGVDEIVREATPWPHRHECRYGAVSAFGFGGTNAHMIMSHDPTGNRAAPDIGRPAPNAAKTLEIIGMAAHFGAAPNLQEYEAAVFRTSSISGSPSSKRFGDFPLSSNENVEGAFVSSVGIDTLTYKMPPAELGHFNPQQALMLKVADAALIDAGLDRPKKGEKPRNIAVILVMELDIITHLRRARAEVPEAIDGILQSLGLELTADDRESLCHAAASALHSDVEPNEVLSYIGNICASRISSLWNFSGPAFTLSSDGVGVAQALEVAQLLVDAGKAEAVLVGAVDITAGIESATIGSRGQIVNSDGFGKPVMGGGPSGLRLGEGAGAVLLRPEGTSGQHVYARLRGLDIHKSDAAGQWAERADAQIIAGGFDRLLERLEIPETGIDLVELDAAEGAGNLAEIEAVAEKLKGRIALGQSESQIGYAGIAAPMASLIKAVLALHHRYLPGVRGWEAPSEQAAAKLEGTEVFIPAESRPWLRKGQCRRALVSLLGQSGGCAALLLEEARPTGLNQTDIRAAPSIRLLIVTGETLLQLDQSLQALLAGISEGKPLDILQRDNLLVWHGCQKPGRLTASLVASDSAELKREIERMRRGMVTSFADGKSYRSPAGSFFTPEPVGDAGKIAFVFPGGFNAYPMLGQKWFRRFPQLLGRLEGDLEDLDAALCGNRLYPESVKALSTRDLMAAEASMLDDIGAMIVTGTSFALMGSRLMREDFGIVPEGSFGYSLGETSMLFDAGVWPTNGRRIDRLRGSEWFRTMISGPRLVARHHWDLPCTTPNEDVWGSLVVMGDSNALRAAAEDHPDVFVTHVNTPQESILAGRPRSARALVEKLGMQSFRAPIGHVLHCEPLRREMAMIAELNDYPARQVADIKLFSAANYRAIDDFGAASLTQAVANVMCQQVDFPQLVEAAYRDGFRTFIELGPAATCSRWISETLGDRQHVAVSISQRGFEDERALVTALAKLAANGIRFNVDELLVGSRASVDARRLYHLELGGTPIRAAMEAACENVDALVRSDRAENRRDEPVDLDGIAKSGLVAAIKEEPCILQWLGVPLQFTSNRINQIDMGQDYSTVQSEINVLLPEISGSGLVGELLRDFVDKETRRLKSADKQFQNSRRVITNLVDGENGRGPSRKPPGVVFDESELLAFAEGSVVDIFGPNFAEVDGYPVRVRLPAPPYFFVSRVTRLEAETNKFEPASLTTEYDIPEDAWYLVNGSMPPGVAVEAGQSDLLLIAFQGIDFANRGERVYRLLDGKLHFKGELPRGGQCLRFDIHIRRHVRQGDAMLFFFDYEGYADDRLALVLRDGCAGFFTAEELAQGGGVSTKSLDAKPLAIAKPLLRHDRENLQQDDLIALTRSDLGAVFGPAYADPGPSVRLPVQMLLMVDRILEMSLSRANGAVTMVGEKDLDPSAWYFTSHFIDDPVMPGSLVAEGATQMLKVWLMAAGMHQCIADPEFQPIPDLDMVIKVRGQIVPFMKTLRYEVTIVESGFVPRPFVRANVVVFHEGRPLVLVENLGLCLKEKPGAVAYPRYGQVDYFSGRKNAHGEHALINELHLAHAAKGCLETAMGKEFGIYNELRAPHIPNGDFQFVDRAVHLTGTRSVLENGSEMITEYDSPADAWYYTDNAHPSMPNCIYLESALQASILLGYFLGCTLRYPQKEFSIRNLEGWAIYHEEIDPRGRTIRHHETLRSTTSMASAILQNFDFSLTCDGRPIYEGNSSFGYFSAKALEHQIGMDGGSDVPLWCEAQNLAFETMLGVDLQAEDCQDFQASEDRPFWRLSGNRLKLLHLAWLSEGGNHGMGYVAGYRRIDPSDWYFRCHFHRDPVMPGSLGIEAIIQAAQLFALRTELGSRFRSPRFGVATGIRTEWKYRGQILMDDPHMWIELHVKDVREEDDRTLLIADASLFKNRLRIYELIDLAIAIREGDEA